MKKTSLIILVFAMLGMGLSTGCTPRMARTAIVGAAVVGTAAAVAHHTAHFHHVNCGCPKYREDGRWVYHYEGGREYYDARAGVWYRY